MVVDLEDLMDESTPGGGQVLGGPHLDAATIDRLLCDAGVHRVVTDGPSVILDVGRMTRTISSSLWNALVLRDQGCRFPGCDRPPRWCEAHHSVFWRNGGTTDLSNLWLGCSRHHHLVHSPGWSSKLLPDATVEVTTPDGRVLTSHPPPRGSPKLVR